MIRKVEIILTRKCNLRCRYCSFVEEREDELDLEGWCRVIDKVRGWGVKFAVIYGGEVMLEFEKLVGLVKYLREQGLGCSIVTNGVGIGKEELERLRAVGLKSITVSWDGVGLDRSISLRNREALRVLELAEGLGYEDVAYNITIHKKNIEKVEEMIRWMGKGRTVLFDIIHWKRSEKNIFSAPLEIDEKKEELFFREGDEEKFKRLYESLVKLKEEGYKIPHSRKQLELLLSEYPLKLNWRCYEHGWLTVDSDGSFMLCEDYPLDEKRSFLDLSLREIDEIFSREVEKCGGCFWITHIGTVLDDTEGFYKEVK